MRNSTPFACAGLALALLVVTAGCRDRREVTIFHAASLARGIKDEAQLTYLHHVALAAIQRNDLAGAKSLMEKYRVALKTTADLIQVRLLHEITGAVALAEKNYETAIAEIKQADLRNAYNLYRLAQAYHGSGRHEEAAEMYEKVARFFADNSLRYAFVRNKATEVLAAVSP